MSIFQEATDSTITKLTDIKIDRKRKKRNSRLPVFSDLFDKRHLNPIRIVTNFVESLGLTYNTSYRE